MYFVMPSTLYFASWQMIFGFEHDTTSISPFSNSCWKIGRFLTQTLIFRVSPARCYCMKGTFSFWASTSYQKSTSTFQPCASFSAWRFSRWFLMSSILFLRSSRLFLIFSISFVQDDFFCMLGTCIPLASWPTSCELPGLLCPAPRLPPGTFNLLEVSNPKGRFARLFNRTDEWYFCVNCQNFTYRSASLACLSSREPFQRQVSASV